MFKDKELRSTLRIMGILDEDDSCSIDTRFMIENLSNGYVYRELPCVPKELDKASKRITELELKLSALMELLSIQELPEEDKRARLKKGNKEVEICEKIIWRGVQEHAPLRPVR